MADLFVCLTRLNVCVGRANLLSGYCLVTFQGPYFYRSFVNHDSIKVSNHLILGVVRICIIFLVFRHKKDIFVDKG